MKQHKASDLGVYVPEAPRLLDHELRHPQEMGKPEIERYLSHLALNRGVAASTQNQTFRPCCFCINRCCSFRWRMTSRLFGRPGSSACQRC